MTERRVADFVETVVELGFRMTAIDDHHFVIDDSTLPPWNCRVAKREFARLKQQLGDDQQVRMQIVRYLMTSGRTLDMA